MLSDHEIARQVKPKPIAEVARELGIRFCNPFQNSLYSVPS